MRPFRATYAIHSVAFPILEFFKQIMLKSSGHHTEELLYTSRTFRMARPVWLMPQANQPINQVPLPEWVSAQDHTAFAHKYHVKKRRKYFTVKLEYHRKGKKQKNNSEKGKKISHFGVKEATVTTRRAVYCIGECIVT